MKICIVGGGNLGTAMAADFASKNHSVNVLTLRPHNWQKNIVATENARELRGDLNLVTSDAAEAFDSAEYIFVTLPSNVQSDFAKNVASFVSDKMKFVMIRALAAQNF